MLRILLVDDDERLVNDIARYLERERAGDEPSFSVAGATTPDEAAAIAAAPGAIFDVFLIDVNLDAEIDGITLMQQLHTLHPDSDFIVFTGYDDFATGQRAFELGAYRYLSKPVHPPELSLILYRLDQQRSTERERDWLKVLADVAEESQRATSKREVAAIIVRGGRRLGFRRARLWWASEDGSVLDLAEHSGSPEIEAFLPIRLRVAESVHAQAILQAAGAAFFQGSQGPTDLERILGVGKFKTPVGDWAGVALRSGSKLLAVVLLDNDEAPQRYSSEQRKLIDLFGRQAAVAIEKAHLFELEQEKSRELSLLHEIGKQITSQAAGDLHTLLLDLRAKIGEVLDVRNFMIVLKDEDIQQLDFRLHFELGHLRRRRWLPLDHGLVGYVIANNCNVFLPQGSSDFLKDQNLQRKGRASRTWLGVSLRVAERSIGALAVQSYTTTFAYTPAQARLLGAIADTIAGAIQAAWAKEKEADAARRLAVLQRFSAEFMPLAEDSTDTFWHAVLTAATADYGLRFNRAMLFMREKGSRDLRGVMGIGHFDGRLARNSWKKDKKYGFDYEHYLERKRLGKIPPTPVETKVKATLIPASLADNCILQVLQSKQRILVSREQVASCLPAQFVQDYGVADYAILPLKGRDRVRGALIVDNYHNGYRLAPEYLDQLETLLTQAALVFENVRQRSIRDTIVDTANAVLGQAAQTPLQMTLLRICEAAMSVTEADNIVIYPLREPKRYDVPAIAAVGLKVEKSVGDRLRQRGVTAHVLNSGILIVPDVTLSSLLFGNRTPLRSHPFIQREEVQAFLSIRIQDAVTGDAVGAMYFNYRHPRLFDERDRRIAEMFAGMAATAIRTTREAQSTQADLIQATEQGAASRQELVVLQQVLEESLAADASEDKLIPVVLHAAHELLEQPATHIALLLRNWNPPQEEDDEPEEVQHQYHLADSGELVSALETDVFRGISGLAFQTEQIQLVNDIAHDPLGRLYYPRQGKSMAELDIPVRSGRRVFGVLNFESLHKDAFTTVHCARLERLAKVSALAFDNVRRQTHLRTLLEAAKAVTSPTELQETADALGRAARTVAPNLSAFTIWYKEPEDKRLLLASLSGVRQPEPIRSCVPTQKSVIAKVMRGSTPILAVDAASNSILAGSFITTEEIVSCAAFPLRVGNEEIGAMFFNYRARHEFSREEETLFNLFAEIAAVSLRDAVVLHVAQKERERLQHSLEITDAVGTTLNLHEALTKIMEKLREIFPSAIPCVMRYNEDERALEFATASLDFYKIDNSDHSAVASLSLDGPGLSVQTALASITQHEPALHIYSSIVGVQNYLPLIRSTRSQMNVGLMSGDKRLLGVLVLESSKQDAFSTDDGALVKGISQQISMAMDRTAESAKLRRKSTVASRTSWAVELTHDAGPEISRIRDLTYQITDELKDLGEIQARANDIDACADRLASVIRNSLSSANEEKQLLDVADVLKNWLDEIVLQEFKDGIDVTCVCHCSDRLIEANRGSLYRAIRHVLRNSIEAMNYKGQIHCSILDAPSNMIEIRIRDSGSGIPPEIHQFLGFEQYSSKEKDGVRGLGLLLTYSLMEDMGGSLLIPKSADAKGALVILRIPR